MQYIGALIYYLMTGAFRLFEGRRSVRSHVKRLRKSGYTKLVFDHDGHTIVIQSHKHVYDDRA